MYSKNTPFEGAFYYSPQKEVLRQAVNAWLSGSRDFDAVIDADALLRDPAHPTQLLPRLGKGDHLHTNDAGYALFANAVPRNLLEP